MAPRSATHSGSSRSRAAAGGVVLPAVAAAALPGPARPQTSPPSLTADEVGADREQAAAQAQARGPPRHIAVDRRRGQRPRRLPHGRRAGHEPRAGALGHGLEGLVLGSTRWPSRKAGDRRPALERGQRLLDAHRELHRPGPLPAGRRLDARAGRSSACSSRACPARTSRRPRCPSASPATPAACRSTRTAWWWAAWESKADGVYGVDDDPRDLDAPPEERAAARRAARGFDAPDPDPRRADPGRRHPAALREPAAATDGRRRPSGLLPWPATPAALEPRGRAPSGGVARPHRPALPDRADGAAHRGRRGADPRPRPRSQTAVTRAAIRQPLGSERPRLDRRGGPGRTVLGFFQNDDAPELRHRRLGAEGAHRQLLQQRRARRDDLRRPAWPSTCATACRSTAASPSRRGPWASSPSPSSHRASAGTDPGAFSVPIARRGAPSTPACSSTCSTLGRRRARAAPRSPGSPNGITIFPGGFPLFKGGRLAGAIGDQRRRRRPGRPDRRRGAAGVRRSRREALRPARGARGAAAVGEVPAAPGAVSRDAAQDRGLARRSCSPRLRGLAAADEVLVLKDGRRIPVTRLARRTGRSSSRPRAARSFSVPEDQVVSPPARVDRGRREQAAGPEGRAEDTGDPARAPRRPVLFTTAPQRGVLGPRRPGGLAAAREHPEPRRARAAPPRAPPRPRAGELSSPRPRRRALAGSAPAPAPSRRRPRRRAPAGRAEFAPLPDRWSIAYPDDPRIVKGRPSTPTTRTC